MLIKLRQPRKKRGDKGKKNRAFGRNKVKCAAYRAARKHEKSHLRRLERHLCKYGPDPCAQEALERYRKLL